MRLTEVLDRHDVILGLIGLNVDHPRTVGRDRESAAKALGL